jgi:CubicO group peptidase (beta-lactamase class C family)
MKKTFQFALLLLFIGLLPSCYLTRALKYKNFDLKDINDFDTDTLKASTKPFHFIQSDKISPFKTYLDTNLAKSQSFSFLVIRNDSILYENYWEQVNTNTLLPTFSVSKSFVSTLIAIAVGEGKIKSLSDPVSNYIPELLKSDKKFSQVTIQHLLDMRSGVKSSEDYYNPTSDVLKMGFGNNIWNQIKKLKIEKAPGGELDYKSVNTQILAIVLERATGVKIQQYLQEKLWQPLGMESNATWNIDSKKRRMVRAFCCINATTRDYAKLGRLYLNNGIWNGEQILPNNWVQNTTNIDTMVNNEGYKNQWWSNEYSYSFKDSLEALTFLRKTPHCEPSVYVYNQKENKEKGIPAKKRYIVYYLKPMYHAEGLLGQYIYVYPAKNLIIVRTGHYWSHNKFQAADHFLYELGEKYF